MRLHARSLAHPWRSLVVVFALAARPAAAQQRVRAPAADTSAVVIECRIGDVAAAVVEAHARGDTLLLPMARLLALAGLDSTGTPGERSLGAAAMLLHADASFDPTALVVQFADSGTLPVSRRAARGRARAALRDRAASLQDVAPAARVARAATAATLSYSAQRDGAVTIAGASRAFGGVLEGTLAHVSQRRARATLSWTSVPASSGGGSRVRIGAIDELGGAAGILLTNAPLERADTLQASSIVTSAVPGTEIELFEDGDLVAADSVGEVSVSRLRVPHRYGTHVIRLVTHEPSGAAYESSWVESNPDALQAHGTLRYVVAAGRCARRPCAPAMASFTYAPLDRVTIGAALAPPTRLTTRATTRAPLALRETMDARIGEAALLSIRREGTGGATAELRIDRSAVRRFVVRSDPAGVLSASPLLPGGGAGAQRRTLTTGSWSLPGGSAVDVAAAFTRSTIAAASMVSTPMRFGIVQGSIAAERQAFGSCVDWSAGALLFGTWLPRALSRFRSALLRLRADQRASACGRSSRSVLLVLPTASTAAVELSASWNGAGASRRPVLGIALRRRIGSFLSAHAELAGGDGSYVARSDVAGSLVVDGLRRSISPGADPTSASATVDGVIYVDDNANGRRDDGEPVVPGAVVRIDEASAVADARGIYVLAGLVPDRRVRLSVDSLSVEDGGWIPASPVGVVLTARTVVRVDIALQRRGAGRP